MPRLLWVQKQDIGPAPSAYFAMCYDGARKRTLLFNGDTWEWDGTGWTQLEDIGPGTRFNTAMVFDEARNVVVLFGGWMAPPPAGGSDRGDTWEWDGELWVQVADTGPSPRTGHAMAYDSTRQRVVLFGGWQSQAFRDTWEWDGNEWLQREDVGPPARYLHDMAFDRQRERTVLFGGAAARADPHILRPANDTWEWNGDTWTQASDMGPSPRSQHRLAWDEQSIVLVGGETEAAAPSDMASVDTWEWDGVLWRQRSDMGPMSRFGHGMAYDIARKSLVAFGGTSLPFRNALGDTWERYDRAVGAVPP